MFQAGLLSFTKVSNPGISRSNTINNAVPVRSWLLKRSNRSFARGACGVTGRIGRRDAGALRDAEGVGLFSRVRDQ